VYDCVKNTLRLGWWAGILPAERQRLSMHVLWATGILAFDEEVGTLKGLAEGNDVEWMQDVVTGRVACAPGTHSFTANDK
jgi:hypothetical protein